MSFGSTSQSWQEYKNRFIDHGKVIFTQDGTGVSEGMGYGMLMAVQNNDQATFDTMLDFIKNSGLLDQNGLLNWKYNKGGVTSDGHGSATDADEDMAYALLLASKQWRSNPTHDYTGMATQMIKSIYNHDVSWQDPNNPQLLAGDSWGGNTRFNPSYVDPMEWAMFAKADPEHAAGWNALIKSSIDKLNPDPKTGLIGNWNDDNNFGYDACRVPMRLAEYYRYLNGLTNLTSDQQDQKAKIKTILNNQFKFFFDHQMPNGGLYAGYSKDGNSHVDYGDKAAFNGPVMTALSIMLKCNAVDDGLSDTQATSFLATLKKCVSGEVQDNISQGPDSNSNNYFNASLGLLNEGWEDFKPPT